MRDDARVICNSNIIALGMALVASHRFPALSSVVLPVVIGATVLFEILGPILTRRALMQMQETHRAHAMN